MNIKNIVHLFERAYKFGPFLPFSSLYLVLFRNILSPERKTAINDKRNALIQRRIRAFVSDTAAFDIPVPEIRKKDAIWVCWLQGAESMPEIVRVCLNSLRRNANGHEIILLTLENYSQYVSLPSIIVDLYQKGRLKHAHFADLLRINILAQQGGLWFDATMLLTKPIANEWFESPFYTIKTQPTGYFVSKCRWSVFILSSQCGNKLFARLADAFEKYLNKNDLFIDYFLFDHFIDILYQTDSEIKRMIDDVPLNNTEVHSLDKIICQPFSADRLNELTQNSSMFKLSTKKYTIEELNKEENSFYKHFKQLYLK